MPWEIDIHQDKNHTAMRGIEWDDFIERNRQLNEIAKTVIPPPHNAWLNAVYANYYIDLKSGDEVNPDHVMRVLRLGTKTKRPLPHVFKRSQTLIVSELWRLAIESLEPGVHQFIPIEIYYETGKSYEIKYYHINIRNIINAIDPDSDCVVLREGQYDLISYFTGSWPLLREKIQNRHLWLQSKNGFGRKNRFMSDELFKIIKDFRPQSLTKRPCTVR
jgi:hypothetical protein